ncbi:ABC transporter permease [Arthrobacter sp. MYb224]|uniref:carbohydrate ABC transporter permease n=1 Tax=Micrococcaceae TaxID=1268 RepID=UPI000CFCC685|nr:MULTISPECIES: sugar ABC transporter permease [unclassified Arthrobacter]PQZ98639.1 ABC transporter permease [Arthrobacter sp. MYb224]PRA02973.1 ABC transporter permease [Arthrobacter sp. MYb229]PRB49443.1 ABC transporter permease [Arthrobacter sp. MYb216]
MSILTNNASGTPGAAAPTGEQPPGKRHRRADPAAGKKTRRRQRWGRLDFKYSPYLYVSPFFILFALVGLFPLVYTFVVSINDWDLLGGAGDWVGLENYAAELSSPLFWNSLFNTFSIFLLSAIPQLLVATFIAAMLDQNIRAKTFWRMSVLIPYVVTPVAVTLIFSSAFDEKYGLINNLLQVINIDPVAWKSEVLPSHLAIATMVNWRWTGYNALILLAAMQAVPRELHESAALDGAGSMRRFFSITLPSIRPTMIFVIITATIGGLQIFTEPKLFNASSSVPGGPEREYQTTVLYLWDLAFNRGDFGRASAVAWMLFLIIIVIGLINFVLSGSIASASEGGSRKRRRAQRLAHRNAVRQAKAKVASKGERLTDAAASPKDGDSHD